MTNDEIEALLDMEERSPARRRGLVAFARQFRMWTAGALDEDERKLAARFLSGFLDSVVVAKHRAALFFYVFGKKPKG